MENSSNFVRCFVALNSIHLSSTFSRGPVRLIKYAYRKSWLRQRELMSCITIANKQDQFKQKQSFKREKEHVQRFILAYFKLLTEEILAVSFRRQ